ncbi:MAG: transglutaminaseTgpA domain-containing protein [Gaiellaceae bacterium]
MRRTLLLAAAPTGLIAWNWVRLERPERAAHQLVWIAIVAVVPALLPRLSLRLAAAAAGLVLVAHRVLAVPFDRHFAGRAGSRFVGGFLDFYDVQQPFDPAAHPRMDGVIMLAIFGFSLAVALAVAWRRALLASLVLLVGAGWPATLLTGPDDLRRGALVLAVILLLLVGLAERPRRRLAPGLALGAAVVLAAFAASTSPAIANRELLRWQGWDFYNHARSSVRYIWSSNYTGFTFPRSTTVVFRVRAPEIPTYWRSTALDAFWAGRWWDRPLNTSVTKIENRYELVDPLLQTSDLHRSRWVEQEVTIEGLRDNHFVGATVPVAYQNGLAANYTDAGASSSTDLGRGRTYKVWSYLPHPTPQQLGRSPAYYPAAITSYGPFLEVAPGVRLPELGALHRRWILAAKFRIHPELRPYRPLYEQALRVVGHPKSPYAAAVALEGWLRDSPEFLYDERPPRPPYGVPALVDFVTRTHRGYCQHYAGAMALMLRYLGIPARVGAGFTSGSYDSRSGEWVVSDHDAHTWVEVWFPGYGWMPFDPTPGRGTLGGSYTTASPRFDALGVRQALGGAFAIRKNHPFDPSTLVGAGGKGVRAGDVPRLQNGVGPGGGSIPGALLRLALVLGLGALALLVAAKLAVFAWRRLARDPRRIAGACRRELVDFLRDQGATLPASATVAEVGAAVESQYLIETGAFVSAVTQARFAPWSRARPAARLARRELRRLLRSLRRELTRTERALGFVSLRSLGLAR